MRCLRRASHQQGAELNFDALIRRSENLAPRHDDNIDGGEGFVVTEQLADQTFGSVALDGSAHLPRRCYTETSGAPLSFPREHRHEASGAFEACLVDEFEVGPLSDVLGGPEADHLLLVRNGKALSSLCTAALQYLPAILGRHTDQEPMPFRAAAGIWLKRSLALLRSSHFSPRWN
jgi:hypothetical protein